MWPPDPGEDETSKWLRGPGAVGTSEWPPDLVSVGTWGRKKPA